MSPELLFDLALVSAVLLVAYRALTAPELFTGVVFYIGFGLLLAIVWVRLRAPDLALAEAAIGAGITGAMLLDAARQLGTGTDEARPLSRTVKALGAGMAFVFAVALAATLLSIPAPGARDLSAEVARAMPMSGVSHPVTAVLLNFRGYDTWLEIGVLFAAAVAILVIRRDDDLADTVRVGDAVSPIAGGAARLIVPFGVLVGGYLLWRGTQAPGGAFQAGATLGALGVLLSLIQRSPIGYLRPLPLRLTLGIGFAVFTAVGLLGLLLGTEFLRYPEEAAGDVILVIEFAATISIAATLVVLFNGGRESSVPTGTGGR